MSHCGIPQMLEARSLILSPCGLPGRYRRGFPRVGTLSCPLLSTISNGTPERSDWPATRRADQPAVFHPDYQALSNSLNCEKCLLARLPGMFRLPKSSYNRRVIVTFMNLRICAGLYSTLFLIVAKLQRV
ncbi:uncharacterized protein TNCV_2291641 [Trichonephila clavipes]|uniref:Uncharacterized protein n=1 Tax=Trichonephila clavipes TaxID=2585209 RepID=A0A8X6RRK4_TRICX|nr:uncharacterized protein TNCV_2291641 [Trichonephila clavipes]